MGSRWVSFFSQVKTLSHCCRCKSFPPATARRDRAAGGLAALLTVGHAGLHRLAGRGRIWFLFVLLSLIPDFTLNSLFIGLSRISLAVWFMGFVPKEKPLVPLLHLEPAAFCLQKACRLVLVLS